MLLQRQQWELRAEELTGGQERLKLRGGARAGARGGSAWGGEVQGAFLSLLVQKH